MRYIVSLLALVSCAHLSTQDKLDLSEYEAAQGACIAATPKDRAAIDACRARVKADWCTKWARRFDAGICESQAVGTGMDAGANNGS